VFAFLLEVAILFGGMYLYLKTTQSISRTGRFGIVIFGFVMLMVQSTVFFHPPPSSDKAAAITALVFYFVFAGVACWLEKQLIARSRASSTT
jgi:heme/copper-type cytochrome/quinol oxidase subunit 4